MLGGAAYRTAKAGTAISRRVKRIGLFWSIVSALVLGAALAVGAQWVLHGFIATSNQAAQPIDLTKLSLTVVAGVGGIVALVVAYRRQRDLEQGRFVERFGAAAAQLGNADVAVRIAGVYAMAGVADESEGLRRQQCIDVLCGYLRLPYTPELGANHQTKRVRKRRRRGGSGENEDHFEYRQNDREVRQTIVRTVADHLQPQAQHSWSASNFDFRTAHLESVDFRDATFCGDARFESATFYGDARFDNATFSGTASFGHATFSGDAWFDAATFSGDAQFNAAMFSGTAWFQAVTFAGKVDFNAGTFSGDVEFGHATFSGKADFEHATFSGEVDFGHATFCSTASFSQATFSGAASFEHATFFGDAWFGAATFSSSTWFGYAKFSGYTQFGAATFSGTILYAAGFDFVTFSGETRFDGAAFSGDGSFLGGSFGTKTISFDRPKKWGPPGPKFDWDDDITRKPKNIEPQGWPPAVASVTSSPPAE